MQLLLKQRVFSWLDSYDIYDEFGNVVFSVKGKLSWGHCLEIYDAIGNAVGMVKEELLHFTPQFCLYIQDNYIGKIKQHFTFFTPKFTLECNDWEVTGDFFEWDYQVVSQTRGVIMTASKQLLRWSDTYVLDIYDANQALLCLMIVLAIDAAKCSRGNG